MVEERGKRNDGKRREEEERKGKRWKGNETNHTHNT